MRCTICRHEKIRARHASNTADCSRGGLVAAGEPLALRKREERSTRYPAACRPSPLVGESQHRGRWIWPLEPRQRLAARIPERRAFAPAAARPPLSDGAGALHAGALGLGRWRRRLLEEVREVPLLLLALGGARGDGGVGRARANGVAPQRVAFGTGLLRAVGCLVRTPGASLVPVHHDAAPRAAERRRRRGEGSGEREAQREEEEAEHIS
mmetsp:Transcript_23472/g.69065  ORF Transcript_23472/g.69065 Transcript_23472/m.69065 type:complete len:211 (-) Transcript_23472:38-670(-)